MKRTAAMIMIIALLISIVQPAYNVAAASQQQSGSTTILDSSNTASAHWAEATLNKWSKYGMIKGDASGDLQPNKALTRAELIAIMNRLFQFNTAESASTVSYTDVAEGAWYYDDIVQAEQVGYIQGYTDGTMKPNQYVSRQEAIVLLQRLFMLAAPQATSNLENEQDIASYAREAIERWYSYGYVQGDPNGSLRAEGDITRAEFLTLLDRVVPLVVQQSNDVSEGTHVQGSLFLQAGDLTLKNVTIDGDLYIAEGDVASILLQGVTVKGRIIVMGNATELVLQDSSVSDVYISTRAAEPLARIITQGKTNIQHIYVMGSASIESEAGMVGEIILAPDLDEHVSVRLKGSFSSVTSEKIPDPYHQKLAANSRVTLSIDGHVKAMELNQLFQLALANSASYVENLIVGEMAGDSELSGAQQQYYALDNRSAQLKMNAMAVPQGKHNWRGDNGEGTTVVPTRTPTATPDPTTTPEPTPTATPEPPFEPTANSKQGSFAGTTAIDANTKSGLHLAIKVSYDENELYEAGDKAPSGGTVINPYLSGTDISGVDEITNRYVHVLWLDQTQTVVHARKLELTADDINPIKWQLQWEDDFAGNEIDQSKWNFVEKGDGFGNNELQYYTAREENARIEDGNLVIEARKENYSGMNYTSAKLTTENKASWTYGRFEIRAKLPEGQGMWPAIWMMPEDIGLYGTWPSSGEIDIMELVGNDMHTVHGTLHYGTPHTSTGYSYQLPDRASFAEDFHEYAIEWEPGEIRWYVDDQLFAVQNDWFARGSNEPTDYTYPAPFDRDFYMQLNVAVGGTWPGDPDATTQFPQRMLVDYVRAYELAEGFTYREPKASRPGQRDQGKITEGKAPLADGNYIYNGTFDQQADEHQGIEGVDNSSYWTFRVGDGGAATIANDQDAMKLSVSSGGNATYAVQLIQHPVPLELGQRYRLTFDAKSSTSRNIEVKLSSGGEGGWSDYAASGFAVDSTWRTQQYDFTMHSYTHATARIEFNAGGGTGDVWLDNIRLEKIDVGDLHNRDALSDGNYIYNGQFNLGLGSLAFWDWKQYDSAKGHVQVGQSVQDKQARITIEEESSAEQLQLVQPRIFIENQGHYVLSYYAKSDVARTITVRLVDESTKEILLEQANVALNDSWESYQQHFEFTIEGGKEIELQFLVGGELSTIWLDQVKLEKLTVYELADQPVMLQAENTTYETASTILGEGSSRYVRANAESSLSYMVDVAQAGEYKLALRVRTEQAASLAIGDQLVALPNSEGQWTTVLVDSVSLAQGLIIITLNQFTDNVELNWLALMQQDQDLPAERSNNLVRNGMMLDDLAYWEFWTEAGAAIRNDNGQMRFDITNVGGQTWSILTKQSGIALQQGKFYTLSFTAHASKARSISVGIENNYNARYMNDVQLTLGTKPVTYFFDFEMGAPSDQGALVFQLGNLAQAAGIGKHSVWIDDVTIVESRKVGSMPFTMRAGEQDGSTVVEATAASEHQLAVIVSNQALAVPNTDSSLPRAEQVIYPYVSGTDITGVDPVNAKYIGVYEVDAQGQVTRFAQMIITAQDMKPYPVNNPAPQLDVAEVVAGSSHSTTRIYANVTDNHHLVAQVSHLAIAAPELGSRAPQGGTIVNPYRSGQDLSGVDPQINRYVALYEVNAQQEVQRYSLIELETAQITEREWTMVWQDEFDEANIDESKWNFVQGGGGYGNQELQNYTNRSENARIEDGKLVIQARKENYQGSAYTSAKLETSGKAKWTYGRYEIRAKLPEGQGLWPAIWMMPEDMEVYGTWPSSGEIDIMEYLGHERSVVHGTLHYGVEHASKGYSYTLPGGQSFSEEFHDFAIEWEPGEIRFYMDGILYAVQNDWFSINNGNPDVYTYPAPFDRDFYMQLNVAVGGTWPGNPDASTVFPQSMVVDYVRVYELPEEEYRKPSYQRPGPRDQSGTEGTARQPLADGNYIYNGGFTEGPEVAEGIPNVANSAYWTLNDGKDFNAAATASYDQGWMKLNITNGGGATYAVQLIQRPLSLEMDKTYTLTFKARASTARNMEVKLSQGGDGGWTDYGRGIASLTTEPQTYQMTFKMLSNTHHNARLELNFGGATGDVWIDDVVFKESGEEAVVERQPLSDGNYIYNGGFELGTDFMSYWKFSHSADTAAEAKVNPKVYERSLQVNTSNGGNSSGEIVLEQKGLPFIQGQWYEVRFKAKADQAQSIDIYLGGDAGEGNTQQQSVAIDEQWTEHVHQFHMKQPTTMNGKLQFKLGGSTITVDIDDVSVKQYFPPISILLETELMTTNDNVEINPLSSGAGAYAALSADENQVGEMQQSFEIEQAGDYMLSLKLSAYRSNRTLSLELDGMPIEIDVPNTHGDQRWSVIAIPVLLTEGEHTIIVTGQAVNLDWLELAPQLVRNGDFSSDNVDPWTLWVGTEAWAGSAVASMKGQDEALHVTVDNLGSQFWSVQLNQMPISLQQGKSYRLAFTASSSLARDMNVAVEIDGGYPQYMLKTVKLTEELTQYSIDFTMNAMSRNDVKLNFILGRISAAVGPHLIILDDIMLAESREQVADASVSENIARKGSFTASSGVASLAFDGNGNTRWESQQTDNQYIMVDLKKSYMIDKMKLSWETAYGKGYNIEVSNDGIDWETAFSTMNGNGGVDELYLVPTEARYVRLQGLQRGTPYGYSLYEFEIYEHDPTYIAEPMTPPQLLADVTEAYVKQPVEITFEQNERFFNSITAVTVDGELLVKGSDYTVLPGSIRIAGYLFPVAGSYEIIVSALHHEDGTVTQQVDRIPPTRNLALQINAITSSGNGNAAFDNNSGTRWISDATDDQYIIADLGDVYEIGRIVLDWEGAYGKAYVLQGSIDGESWNDLSSVTDGNGGIDEILLEASEARYVKLQGIERGTPYGYSLWSFEIYPYDPSGLKLPPSITPTKSSYMIGEDVGLVFAENSSYVSNLQTISVNSVDITAEAVVENASIELAASMFKAGDNQIVITAEGYRDVVLTVTMKKVNVALGATVTALSGTASAATVVDGNYQTRWESEHGVDPQWIMLELSEAVEISELVLHWEGARAASYIIEVSEDGETWEQVAAVNQYNGLKDTVSFEPVVSQYVKVTGLSRALPYGYSLFEIEIY